MYSVIPAPISCEFNDQLKYAKQATVSFLFIACIWFPAQAVLFPAYSETLYTGNKFDKKMVSVPSGPQVCTLKYEYTNPLKYKYVYPYIHYNDL